MNFVSAQQQTATPQQGHLSQSGQRRPLSLCIFRHTLGQRLIARTIRIDAAIEETLAYGRENPHACVDELVRHLRETARWLSHPVLTRNRDEWNRAITLITRRHNRRVYCTADLPR